MTDNSAPSGAHERLKQTVERVNRGEYVPEEDAQALIRATQPQPERAELVERLAESRTNLNDPRRPWKFSDALRLSAELAEAIAILSSPVETTERTSVNSPEVDRKVTGAEATERPDVQLIADLELLAQFCTEPAMAPVVMLRAADRIRMVDGELRALLQEHLDSVTEVAGNSFVRTGNRDDPEAFDADWLAEDPEGFDLALRTRLALGLGPDQL